MTKNAISRRAAVGGIGAAAAAAAISPGSPARASDSGSLADHPMTGTWLTLANPSSPEAAQVGSIGHFWADGTALLAFAVTDIVPEGVVFSSAFHGIWKAHTERQAHFTCVQLLSDADGNYLGSVTVDGFPEASVDGQTFIDDSDLGTVTIRDAAGAITGQFSTAGGRPVRGLRMVFGAPRFPDPLPD